MIAAIFVFILLLTKIANQDSQEQLPGVAFALKAQQVIQCSRDEITMVDTRQVPTHLEKDGSWPDCSAFQKGELWDFYLARGEKTRFLRDEKTVWWRKAL